MATRIAFKTCIMACITAVLLFGVQAAKAQTEACCTPGGSCSDLLPTQCTSVGGIPAGAGTSCAGNPNICAERPCCLPNGTCQLVSPQYCQQVLNGIPRPLGTTCAQANCFPQQCDPLPDGSGCQTTTQCPIAGEICRPKCARFDPALNKYLIVDCDCVNTNECYLQLIGGGGSTTIEPDNGTGTADLPPNGGVYVTPLGDMQITNGLNAGDTIQIDSFFDVFVAITRTSGGPLGGETEQYGATMHMPMHGTGSLTGFNPTKTIQVQNQSAAAPRTLGDPIQSFDTQMMGLQGQITGDPDFDLLRITAGNSFGMPSPGHTTLTKTSGPNWAVDSFFDITYRIDFIGHSPGPLGGHSGSTTGTIRMALGTGATQCTNTCPPGQTCIRTVVTNPNGSIDVCCVCQPTTCQPNPTGTACQPIQCPVAGEECTPRCANFNPQTGQAHVIDCTCRPPTECHIEMVPGAVPDCTGVCPPGKICERTTTLKPDGSYDLCCDCHDEPACAPNANGTGCQPVVCPNPDQHCQPKCVRQVPGVVPPQFEVIDCECIAPNDCHIEVTAAAGPSCIGVCPPGQQCDLTTTVNPADGSISYCCTCIPQICQPDPTGGACQPTQCPTAGQECEPRCVKFDPATGATTVVDCDCRSTNECHVQVTPGAFPGCVGTCPPGKVCEDTMTANADGTYTICCDCKDQEVCQPNSNRTGCEPVVCPDTTQQCHPKCVRQIPGITPPMYEVVDCECMGPDDCHVEFDAAGSPTCVGVCPQGQECKQITRTNADGTTDLCCECHDLPQVCQVNAAGNGCVPVQCPPDPITGAAQECRPKCAKFNPLTGQFTVVDCECIDLDQCHMEFPNVGAPPVCVGTCPPGQTCVQTTITNPDGTTSICCECQQQSYPKFSQPPTPDREDIASNLDWNDQIPNPVIADDFQSDGRPITQVRWWGSYIDPRYAPVQFGGAGQAPYEIDGWLISFHEPIVATQIKPALGVYFAPAADVQIIATNIVPCDGHPVFQYLVDLSRCCLLCVNPDSRDPAGAVPPAQCDAFREEHCFMYDIDIQAEVGRIYFKPTNGDCHQCLAASTVNNADGDFWGWHSTNIENGRLQALRSTTGVSHLSGDLTCQYGPWQNAPQVCTFQHRINMAFDLLTNNPNIPAPCPQACCLPNGGCVDTLPGSCSGTPQGVGTTCATTICPPPIIIIQWRSMKTHSGGASLPIVLDPLATGATSTKPTVETRGTTTANQGVLKVQVDFSSPVTLVNAANITVTYRPTIQGAVPSVGPPSGVIPSSVVMADADTLDIIFTAGQIPNLGCANINIGAGTFAETITGDTDCNIRVLAGDMVPNGLVQTADMLATKAEVTAGTLATAKPKFDITLSAAVINTADMLAVKAQIISPAKAALCP